MCTQQKQTQTMNLALTRIRSAAAVFSDHTDWQKTL